MSTYQTTGRPHTVAEAVLITLRDFALAYKRKADDVLASRGIYERAVADFAPEAIILGGQRAIENERYYPSVFVLKKYAAEEHGRIMAATSAVMPRQEFDGLRCHICGAEATWQNNRYHIEHDRIAHRVPTGEAQ